jgi:hypothetical protein
MVATGKNYVNDRHRGITWTGDKYVVVEYVWEFNNTTGNARFLNDSFEPIDNKYGRSEMRIPRYSHGASWDGKYLYTLSNNNPVIYITNLDVDLISGVRMGTLITGKSGASYCIEYVDGKIYFTTTVGTTSNPQGSHLHCLKWTSGNLFEWVFQDVDIGDIGAGTHVSLCAVGKYLYLDSATSDNTYLIL